MSGGPDSLCLLHLLKRLSSEYMLNLVVAHLNHCLRPEAVQEADGVEKIASDLSLPFEVRAVDIRNYKKQHAISEEEAGRKARYDFLFETAEKYKASRIALGHHLDDQAETVLLNVIRGTGVDGLAGMLPRRTRGDIQLVRPLLCLRRSEIESYCAANNLQPFTDSSNLETNYTRNKLRLELIPQLQLEYNPRIREALFRLGSLAADDRMYLQNMAIKQFYSMARFTKTETILDRQVLLNLPPALRGRVLRYALIKYISTKEIGNLHIEQLLDLVEKGRTGRQLNLPGKLSVYSSYERLVIKDASDPELRAFEPVMLQIPGKTVLPGGYKITAGIKDVSELTWPPPSYRAYLDLDKISSGSLMVRSRRPGDRFHPQGAPGAKKVKEFFIDQRIPFYQRESLPLVTEGENIIWVAGIRIADSYKVTGQTKQALVLEYKVLRRPYRKA
ncbi:MAG: tRNA lysidine(34) synthetase TilS [Bacillota bacterium]